MTAYTVNEGHIGVEPFTLVANQVDSVTFTSDIGAVEIVSSGAAEVRVSTDGSDPTAGAAGASTNAFRIPAGPTIALRVPMRSSKVVRVTSPGTPTVSVQVAL